MSAGAGPGTFRQVLPWGRAARGRGRVERGRGGLWAVSWPCALPQEGVSRELVRERQYRERLGRLQGGTKSTTKGMKQRHPEPRPAQQRGGWAGGQAFPFCFLSKLPTLETCFYYTRACNLHCFSEKDFSCSGTGSFLQTLTGTHLGQGEPPAPL